MMKKRLFGIFFFCIALLLGTSQTCLSEDKSETTLSMALLPNAQFLYFWNKEYSEQLLKGEFLDTLSLVSLLKKETEAYDIIKQGKELLDVIQHTDVLLSVNMINLFKEEKIKAEDIIFKIEWLLGMELDDELSYNARLQSVYIHNYEIQIVKVLLDSTIMPCAKLWIDIVNDVNKKISGTNTDAIEFKNIEVSTFVDDYKMPEWYIINSTISYNKKVVYNLYWAISKTFKTIVVGPKDVVFNQLMEKTGIKKTDSFNDSPSWKLYNQYYRKPVIVCSFSPSTKDADILNKYLFVQDSFPKKSLLQDWLKHLKNTIISTSILENGNIETSLKLDFNETIYAQYAYLAIENDLFKEYRKWIDVLDEQYKISCLVGLHQHRDDNLVTISTKFTPFDVIQLYRFLSTEILTNETEDEEETDKKED